MVHYQTRSRQKNRKKSRYSTQKKSNVKKRAYRRKPNTTRYVNRAHQSPQSTSTSSLSVDCSESACSLCRQEQNQSCDPGNKHNGGSASESQSGSFRDSMPASRKQSPEASP